MRALRIELRRSVALGIGLALLAFGAFTILAGGYFRYGGWAALSYTLRDSLLILWPLAAGAGAWQARREQSRGVAELMTTSARPAAAQLAPVAIALAVTVSLAYLLTLLAGSVRLWLSPAQPYLTLPGLAAAGVGALSLITAAWTGLAVGRAVPSRFTAPGLTLITFMIGAALQEFDLLSNTHDPGLLLATISAPYQQDWVQLPLSLSALQAFWLTALAFSAFCFTLARHRRGRALAVVPATLALMVTFPLLPAPTPDGWDTAFREDPEAMRPVCAEGEPRVCVMRVHSGLLEDLTPPIRQALKAMETLPSAPTAATEVRAESGSPDRQTLGFEIVLGAAGRLEEPGLITFETLREAMAPACEPPSDASFEDYSDRSLAWDLAGTWLTDQVDAPRGENWPDERFADAYAALTALPPQQQAEQIATYYRNATGCTGDLRADLLADVTGTVS
ncbi:hypothetical protein [Kineosporia babensis]|uniref:Uncharacterized protein n=1 Tax=Kineosporia babensis TaxID=499548 RepID=A0A9X1SXY7_9ACTN|nr:hypothetical protein [Kineosporia babensis]MCD5316496.1 hypothetical protein [Kineosporia babensis]